MLRSVFLFMLICTMACMCGDPTGTSNAKKAKTELSEVWSALRDYKTDRSLNNRGIQTDWLVKAKTANSLDETPESLALLALVTVWSHKWHYRNANWNASKFKDDDALTRRALEAKESPEALLARAWLTSNACTLMPENSYNRVALCNESMETYARLRKSNHRLTENWLHFEALWTEAQFLNRYGGKFPYEISAGALNARSTTVCDAGFAIIDDAPVNDTELYTQCAIAFGRAENWSRYFKTTRTHINVKAENGTPTNRSIAAAFTASHPECKSLQMTRKHRLKNKIKLPYRVTTTHQAFCTVAGHIALHCYEFGMDLLRDHRGSPGLDWEGLTDFALQETQFSGQSGRCLYSDEHHNSTGLRNIMSQPVAPPINPFEDALTVEDDKPGVPAKQPEGVDDEFSRMFEEAAATREAAIQQEATPAKRSVQWVD